MQYCAIVGSIRYSMGTCRHCAVCDNNTSDVVREVEGGSDSIELHQTAIS